MHFLCFCEEDDIVVIVPRNICNVPLMENGVQP